MVPQDSKSDLPLVYKCTLELTHPNTRFFWHHGKNVANFALGLEDWIDLMIRPCPSLSNDVNAVRAHEQLAHLIIISIQSYSLDISTHWGMWVKCPLLD